VAIEWGRVCIVVPAFNEEQSIAQVVEGLRRVAPQAEVVVVDDGCTDATADRAVEAGATVVSLPVNLGIGGAVQAGYRYALRRGFCIAVQVDGDGQHDPTEVPRLLERVAAGETDLAIGSRWLGRGDYVAPSGRRIGMRLLALLVRWRTGQWFTDTTSGFRAVGSRALRLFGTTYPTDFPEVESIVIARHAGLKVEEVPVKMSEREYGRSSIGGWRSGYYMVRVAMVLLLGGPRRQGKR
jgi:glycosyltransferase involved in cell wall biosynthesis